MSRIVRALKGQERLAVVFWGYCVAGTLIVGVLMFYAFRLIPMPHRSLGNIVTGVPFVAYFLWAHVSLWRCAFNVEGRGLGYAARCYALVALVYYFVGIAANFWTEPVGIQQVVLPASGPKE